MAALATAAAMAGEENPGIKEKADIRKKEKSSSGTSEATQLSQPALEIDHPHSSSSLLSSSPAEPPHRHQHHHQNPIVLSSSPLPSITKQQHPSIDRDTDSEYESGRRITIATKATSTAKADLVLKHLDEL